MVTRHSATLRAGLTLGLCLRHSSLSNLSVTPAGLWRRRLNGTQGFANAPPSATGPSPLRGWAITKCDPSPTAYAVDYMAPPASQAGDMNIFRKAVSITTQ